MPRRSPCSGRRWPPRTRSPTTSPPDWFFPARQLLGAQLLLAGQPAAAEAVYREDLKRNPDNGWSLYGLCAGRRRRRAARRGRAHGRGSSERAWQHADVRLPGSAFWYAGVDSGEPANASTSPQPSGRRVVNFLVRSTKLVLTERTAASCSSCVERKCSYASMLAATMRSR